MSSAFEFSIPVEARLLVRLQEPFAAGFYELRNASQIRRMGRALKRYAASLGALPAATAALYPAVPLNLRMNIAMLDSDVLRTKLKALLQSYFAMGGLQVHITALDHEALQDAMLHPEKHPNLIVRIGGYTEYFNRLPTELRREVLRRTAHGGI